MRDLLDQLCYYVWYFLHRKKIKERLRYISAGYVRQERRSK